MANTKKDNSLKTLYNFLIKVLADDNFSSEFQLKQIQNFFDYFKESKSTHRKLAEEYQKMDPFSAILTRWNTRLDNRDFRLIRCLLKNGLSPNIPHSDNESPLAVAVGLRDSRLVELLLKAGADPNCIDGDAQPVLHVALRQGNNKITKLLLKNGADPNAPSAAVDFALPVRPLAFIEMEFISKGGKLLSGKTKGSYIKFKKDMFSLAKTLHQCGGRIEYKRPAWPKPVTPLEKAYAECEKVWGFLVERLQENEAARASAAGRAR